ncbi:MAG: MBL fold metallo-hydrolase [bacterium]|nr:MBL fold metallo-hydrolase [bacterium]
MFTIVFFLLLSLVTGINAAQGPGSELKSDSLSTSAGVLDITCVGHASLFFKFNGKIIHVDPFSKLTDYSLLPKADVILITHQHGDHLDPKAIKAIKKESTKIIISKACIKRLKDGTVLENGKTTTVGNLKIEAVPAYNILHKRKGGIPYHTKGDGNGYIITFGDTRVYIAGDSENTPEMKALKNIDVAFLSVNTPMTAKMVMDAVNALNPKILYPYHNLYGSSDLPALEMLLKEKKEVELRKRN